MSYLLLAHYSLIGMPPDSESNAGTGCQREAREGENRPSRAKVRALPSSELDLEFSRWERHLTTKQSVCAEASDLNFWRPIALRRGIVYIRNKGRELRGGNRYRIYDQPYNSQLFSKTIKFEGLHPK